MTTLFISDLHLDAAEPAAGALFMDFLRTRASGAAALYILGDLFEAWVGDDDDDAHRDEICRALKTYSSAVAPVFVMHGNRDFLLQHGFEARTGAALIADPQLLDLHGTPALITHGDALCTADQSYQRLRATVRDPRWQQRFLALPLATRRALARRARAGSRQHTGRMDERIMDVDARAVQSVMRACATRVLIHGHTHRPAIHTLDLDGKPATRIVLGPWHHGGSFLRWDADGYALEALSPLAATGAPE